MRKQRNALRAGLFMFISIALVILVIVAVSGTGRFTQKFNTYIVSFGLGDDVGGLQVGDDVRLGGVKVGEVRRIEVRQPANVDVYIDLPSHFKLAEDADITAQKPLTGPADINITNLGTAARMGDGQRIAGKPDQLGMLMSNLSFASGKLNTDLDKIGATADSFTETGHIATATIQDVRTRVPALHQKYDDLVASAVKMLDAIRDFVGPSSSDFHTTVAALASLSTSLKDKTPGILDQVHTILAKVDVTVAHAASAMEDLQTSAGRIKDTTTSLSSVVQDNHGKFDSIIESLKETSDNLKYGSIEIRHSPWRLLYQPKPDEMANLNTYDSVRQFAEGANSLDDAASALRDALNDKNADPEQVKKLMAQLDDTFAKFQDVQKKLYSDIKN